MRLSDWPINGRKIIVHAANSQGALNCLSRWICDGTIQGEDFLIDLRKILAFICECGGLCHTQAPSEIDCIWGAYGEIGRALFPDIPDKVLFLLLELDVETLGRDRSCG